MFFTTDFVARGRGRGGPPTRGGRGATPWQNQQMGPSGRAR